MTPRRLFQEQKDRKEKGMGDMAFVLGQSAVARTAFPFPIGFVVYVGGLLLVVWLVSWRIRRWFGRSLKAQQDLARSVADVSERLEKIESKLEASHQQKT